MKHVVLLNGWVTVFAFVQVIFRIFHVFLLTKTLLERSKISRQILYRVMLRNTFLIARRARSNNTRKAMEQHGIFADVIDKFAPTIKLDVWKLTYGNFDNRNFRLNMARKMFMKETN
jgi:hypothetical protein